MLLADNSKTGLGITLWRSCCCVDVHQLTRGKASHKTWIDIGKFRSQKILLGIVARRQMPPTFLIHFYQFSNLTAVTMSRTPRRRKCDEIGPQSYPSIRKRFIVQQDYFIPNMCSSDCECRLTRGLASTKGWRLLYNVDALLPRRLDRGTVSASCLRWQCFPKFRTTELAFWALAGNIDRGRRKRSRRYSIVSSWK